MPFFRTYAFRPEDMCPQNDCRPADYFACDILRHEDAGTADIPDADDLCLPASAGPRGADSSV